MPLSKKNVQLVFIKIKTLRQYIKQQMSLTFCKVVYFLQTDNLGYKSGTICYIV